jgi:NAD(P)H-hydrate epimerase
MQNVQTMDLGQFAAEQVWSRETSTQIDRLSCEAAPTAALELMERAGQAIFDFIQSDLENQDTILILAGPGNNGGDALVCARLLHQAGIGAETLLIWEDDKSTSLSCHHQLERLTAAGLIPQRYHAGLMQQKVAGAGRLLVVDGVIGIGLKGSLRDGLARQCLAETHAAINKKNTRVLAIDIPSGLDVDRWEASPPPLPADATLTFGALKPAHILTPARAFCGRTIVVPIGFSEEAAARTWQQSSLRYHLLTPSALISYSPWQRLSAESNKFDRGHVLVIGGSRGKTGAPLMSCLAALRCGAGWVSCSLSPDAHLYSSPIPLEITLEDLWDEDNRLCGSRLKRFCQDRKVRSILLGPGMVRSPLTPEVLTALYTLNVQHGVFLTFDAGALLDFKNNLDDFQFDPHKTVITPHPGEWRKATFQTGLIDSSGSLDETYRLLQKWGMCLLYKSATPVLLSPLAPLDAFCTNFGTNTLSKAGSGDMLAGMIAAHGAIGENADVAAMRSQILLASLADKLSQRMDRHSIIASDFLDAAAWRQD